MYHPWESTLRELAERVRGEFGPEKAGEIEALAFYRGTAEDEILEQDVYRALIVGVGLKPEDFGLFPDDELSTAPRTRPSRAGCVVSAS